MRISDWSSDVCSSDLDRGGAAGAARVVHRADHAVLDRPDMAEVVGPARRRRLRHRRPRAAEAVAPVARKVRAVAHAVGRSEEHTSELQSLMRISYAVFCLEKKNETTTTRASTSELHTIKAILYNQF